MLLKGRAAIVTGAAGARGIGRATARLFAEHGCRVAILDLDAAAAEAAAQSLAGSDHLGLVCDVARKAACDRAVQAVADRFGRIDILVNNAGITAPDRVMEVTEDAYRTMMAVNMGGTLLMTQAVVPHLRAAGGGAIVNMSSVAAQRGGGVFGGSHYAAAKAAILGYTKACARELGPENIRVNAVCPSYVDTDILAGRVTEDRLEEIVATVPMGRAGRAEEVAGAVLFLASDLAGYVTGSEVDVNGGSHIH